MRTIFTYALAAFAQVSSAQVTSSPAQVQTAQPVTVESYYRAKWGSADEFKELYKKNEAAMLIEMKRRGFIKDLRFDEPFTHVPGEPRWDLRATVTYRDAAAAVEVGGSWDEEWAAARKRLRPDKKTYDTEEARRFSLLEDHWDIIVTPFDPKP